jgi:5'-nucleotidase
LAEVVVWAPDRERSAAGHSLTLHSPLRIFELRDGFFAVDGTPTDCVNMGIHNMLPFKPDLVVSGINHGANLGGDITYSGHGRRRHRGDPDGDTGQCRVPATYERQGHF